jgi:hypothetical protein
MEINGSTQNPKVELQPDVPQIPIPIFSFLDELIGEMGKYCEEWMAKEKLEVVGTSNQPTQLKVVETSNQPTQSKDSIQILSSPRKKPTADIVLRRTLKGIHVDS